MNRAAFYAALRKRDSGIFGTSLRQAQVDGMERLLSAVHGRPVSHAAYLLATAYHETGFTMQPIREAFGKSDGDTINRLEKAWKAGKLGQVRAPYWRPDATGKAWFGRGYVQLTHRDNYAKAAAITGVDLLSDPSKAMHPEIAATILVEGCTAGIFTGARLSQYLPGDYVGARRVVNGQDKAHQIATYARAFEAALLAAGYSVTPQSSHPRDGALTVPGQVSPKGNPLAWIAGLVGSAIAFGLASLSGKLCSVPLIAEIFSRCGG